MTAKSWGRIAAGLLKGSDTDLGPLEVELKASTGVVHVGNVGGHTPRITGAQLVRAADTTQYSAGDHIANSTNAASVVPIPFANIVRVAGGSGYLTGMRCVVAAGSGTIVISNFAFDLLLFRPAASIPFADGSYPADNAALNIAVAAMREQVAVFSYSASGWRNQAGANAAAGLGVNQAVPIGGVGDYRTMAPLNLASLGSSNLIGVMQAQAAWNPGNVAQTFDFYPDIQQD